MDIEYGIAEEGFHDMDQNQFDGVDYNSDYEFSDEIDDGRYLNPFECDGTCMTTIANSKFIPNQSVLGLAKKLESSS